MLKQIDNNLWIAQQPLKYFGFEVGTRMSVILLENKELVVISPIKINDTITKQLNELGNVTHIIAPNLFHHLFLSEFKKVFPSATLWGVEGLERKKPELVIDKIIGKNGDRFIKGIEYLPFEGLKTFALTKFASLNEYVFFHQESRTLILTDAAYNFDENFELPLITKLLMKGLGSYGNLSLSFLEKIAISDKNKLYQSVQKILKWDFERVIMAHGSIINKNGKEKLKQGYEKFLGYKF